MSFARHQTFYLRAGWLAKALEELRNDDQLFWRKDAAVRLGIGKNMAQSLRFWVRAAGLVDKDAPRRTMPFSRFGELVYAYDPYFELDLTWWIIHYHIISDPNEATSWYYLFNEFPRNEFDRETFVEAVERYSENSVSRSSYQKDYDCIVATYVEAESDQSPEDNTICPLTRLGLLETMRSGVIRKVSPEKVLPGEVLFYVLVSSGAKFQNISSLLDGKNSLGKSFNLNIDMIYKYLDVLQEMGLVSFSRTAGVDSVQVSMKQDPWDLIEHAYKQIDLGVAQ